MGEAQPELATNPIDRNLHPSLVNRNNCEPGRPQLQKQQSAILERYGLQPVHNRTPQAGWLLATEGDPSSIETAGIDGVTGCEKAHALYQGTALAGP
jgi:hypothetical protein